VQFEIADPIDDQPMPPFLGGANDHVGFFAQMVWCLYIYQHCERRGLIPDIRLTGEVYLDPVRGPNWLYYYFNNPSPVGSDKTAKPIRYTKKITEWEDMGQPFGTDVNINAAARTFQKFICPKPHVVKKVDDFWKGLDANDAVVGIHFRGTDKSTEAPRVSWNHYLEVLERYLRSRPDIRAVFVASDEKAFIDFMARSVKDRPVYWRDDHYRSSDGRPVHTQVGKVGGYEKGEDALGQRDAAFKMHHFDQNDIVSFSLGFDLQSGSQGHTAQQAVREQDLVRGERDPQQTGYRISSGNATAN
jgi:hypothetical protein